MKTCCLLIEKYPEGYTLEELHSELASSTNLLSCFDVEWLGSVILGMKDDRPHSVAMVSCWKLIDGKIYFDPNASRYSSYDDENLRPQIERWRAGKQAAYREQNQGDTSGRPTK